MSKEMVVMKSEDGRLLQLPSEVFDALWEFIMEKRRSGSVTLQFKSGGVAGVKGVHVSVSTEIQYK